MSFERDAKTVVLVNLLLQIQGLDRSKLPSCTKRITVRYHGAIVVLSLGPSVTLNGADVPARQMPKTVLVGGEGASSLVIRRRSSRVASVSVLPEGIEVLWDGRSRLYVDAPQGRFKGRGRLEGLCGDFDGKAANDPVTPDNDGPMAQDIPKFADR